MRHKTAMLLSIMLFVAIGASAADEHKYRPLFYINTDTEIDALGVISIHEGYYDFADMIRSFGFRVDQDHEPNMTAAWLEETGIDVLMIPVPYSSLEPSEMQALRGFIKGGGTVVFLLSHHPYFQHDHDNINSFTKPFGITIVRGVQGGIRGNPPVGTGMWRPNRVSNVKVQENHAQLAVDSRYAQVGVKLEDGNLLTAYSTRSGMLGSGQLIVHGDVHMFYRGASAEDSLYKEGNEEFARNFILHAAGVFDLTPTKVKLKPKAPVAGKKATVVVQVKNDYHVESAPVKLQVTLVAIGGAPAEEERVLATVTLPSIKVGKKMKQKIKVTLPANLEPGEYFLSATIDPGKISPDIFTSNNVKRSKIYTIQ